MIPSQGVPLEPLIVLFSVLLLLGTGLTLPLYRFDFRKFSRSSLSLKIIVWIPIFSAFLGVLYLGTIGRLVVLLVLLGAAWSECLAAAKKSPKAKRFITLYFIGFTVAMLHFHLLNHAYPADFPDLLIMLCLASVLSDVTAFFYGNYRGGHKLPDWINKDKSWEGVFGQLAGAFIGVALVSSFIVPVASLWLFVPLGLGSAAGDLINSWAKRRLHIKNWSRAIPGHGGFIDRLASLAGSAVLLFYFLKLTGLG